MYVQEKWGGREGGREGGRVGALQVHVAICTNKIQTTPPKIPKDHTTPHFLKIPTNANKNKKLKYIKIKPQE